MNVATSKIISNPALQHTELGTIPLDWKLARLGDVCTIFGRIGFRGYTVNDIVGEAEGAISLSPSNIQHGRLDLTRCTYLSWPKWRESPEIQIAVGDTLLVKTGSTVGKTAYVDRLPIDATVNPQIVVLKKRKVDDRFLGYVMGYTTLQSQLVASTVGGALPTLSQKQVADFLFPCPLTNTEQEAIAEALSDVDALIESLEALIAKKRATKQGAMQDLLSGRKRLPGFSGEWKSKPLANLADIRSGGTPSTTNPDFWEGNVPWCTPTDITALAGAKYIGHTVRTISVAGLRASSAEVIPPRSVIMTSRATIGECAINLEPVTTNQGFKNLVPHEETNVEFLYYLMSMQKERLIALCGGSTFLEIGKSQLLRFEVLVPPTKTEQEVISGVLADVDNELGAHISRLKKARQIKQGMMQELLTGRVRLV